MALQRLSDIQNDRLNRLEQKLRRAAGLGDLITAKNIAYDIQTLLRPHGYETRLMQVKNWLYEAGIQSGEYPFAIDGLKSVKLKTNKNTRVYLEATALLAIAYLRNNELEKAKPEIKEVLRNDKVIKSDKKRKEFRKAIIERFDEEVSLHSMKGLGLDKLDSTEIEAEAQIIAETNTELEILDHIGENVPQSALRAIFNIDEYAKNQLPSAERSSLPSPKEIIKEGQVGKTLFKSIKRTLYNSLCDKDSDTYKAWYNDGLQMILSRKYISATVVGALMSLGIGIKMIATYVVALIIKFGIEVFCNHHKPEGIMQLR